MAKTTASLILLIVVGFFLAGRANADISGNIECSNGEPTSGVLFDDSGGPQTNLVLALSFPLLQKISGFSLQWTDPTGKVQSVAINNTYAIVVAVAVESGATVAYSCGSVPSFAWDVVE
jgi:hypothetical protein